MQRGRKHVRCTMCTSHRWKGNSAERFKPSESARRKWLKREVRAALVLGLVALAAVGCAGGTASGPFTYRDAITCSKGLTWTQSDVEPAEGSAQPTTSSFTVSCPGRAKWSGPPSDAEVEDAAAKLRAALEALGS